jgi:hypothetical protein
MPLKGHLFLIGPQFSDPEHPQHFLSTLEAMQTTGPKLPHRNRWIHDFAPPARCEIQLTETEQLRFNWLAKPSPQQAVSKAFRLEFRSWLEDVAQSIAAATGRDVITLHGPSWSKMSLAKPKAAAAL